MMNFAAWLAQQDQFRVTQLQAGQQYLGTAVPPGIHYALETVDGVGGVTSIYAPATPQQLAHLRNILNAMQQLPPPPAQPQPPGPQAAGS